MAYNPAGGGYKTAGDFGEFGDAIVGRNAYRVQTAEYDPRRADEERRLALGQRSTQTELAQAIQNRAMGRGGPSVAELQMQRGLGQAQQAAAQQAASARGVDRAAAFRQAQNAQANMASQANQDAGMMRAQEQIAAQQLGVGANQGIRAQDIESRGVSAQEGIANLNAQTAAEQMRYQQAEGNAERRQKAAGGIATAAGGLLAMSDRESKEKIRRLSAALDAAQGPAIQRASAAGVPPIGPVKPYEYQYKPEFAAALGQDTGRRTGVMAQDLQKSPLYKNTVVPTGAGLALDKDRLLQANTAAVGSLNERLQELETAGRKAVDRVNEPVDPKQKKFEQALESGKKRALKNIERAGSPKAAGR